MSAVVMIPTEDQKMQYYMSRTKTGMDNMVIHAQEQLAGTAERMEQIEYNIYLTEKLKANVSDQMKTDKAAGMITELQTSLNNIAMDVRMSDNAYLSTKTRNYIGFSDDSTGFAGQVGLVSSFLCAVLILIVVFTCVFLRIYFSDNENEV